MDEETADLFQKLVKKMLEQAAPSPCTSYAMFYNGEFLTNEQFNDKKFLKMVQANKQE